SGEERVPCNRHLTNRRSHPWQDLLGPSAEGETRRATRHVRQEAFLTLAHAPCVPLILPQDSAIVSNTPSWRNAGFWYGSLLSAGSSRSAERGWVTVLFASSFIRTPAHRPGIRSSADMG